MADKVEITFTRGNRQVILKLDNLDDLSLSHLRAVEDALLPAEVVQFRHNTMLAALGKALADDGIAPGPAQ